MVLFICSSPDFIDHEQDLIRVLFEEGINTFHVRKPKASEDELRDWLKLVSKEHLNKIVIHSHWKLVQEFQLKGIHIGANAMNKMEKEELRYWMNKHPHQVSSSIHNKTELETLPLGLAYVWLSPVFTSISKPNYIPSLSEEKIKELVQDIHSTKKTKVFALGGITASHISEVKMMGFDGAVVLGSLWNNAHNKAEFIQYLNRIQSACKKAVTS